VRAVGSGHWTGAAPCTFCIIESKHRRGLHGARARAQVSGRTYR
jgi:hypothetical protein